VSTAVDVATACHLTVRRVQQLAKQGVLPKLAPGVYDLVPCLSAYIVYLQAAMSAKSTMDGTGKISNTNQQRSRILDVSAELEELKLAKARGEVLSIADHEAILSDLVIQTKANLMAVSSHLAPRLVGQTDRATIRAQINLGMMKALSELAALVPASRAPKKASAKKVQPPAPSVTSGPLQAARSELGALLAALLRDRQQRARATLPAAPAAASALLVTA
jgi:hypothetical protein